jgi:MEMO1 family protein
MDARSRPALRPVEWIVVSDKQHGRVVVLRDTQGVTDSQAVIPPVLVPVVARFDGARTCEEIARDASVEVGGGVPVDVVVRLAAELEHGLFLEGDTFRAAKTRVEREFAQAPVRPASHAGAAYHGERSALEQYIEQSCLAKANGAAKRASNGAKLVALVAPHIDPWRGAVCYGHAYGAMAAALPAEADTFVLLGTSHAPMRQPFALCRKGFATPLGTAEADFETIDALAAKADGFDPYADQINHKREHSLEFQAVFLKYVLRERPIRIVPILAALGAHQAQGQHPEKDPRVARFVDGIRGLLASRPGRVVIVAGADLAHVGPRFGDAQAFDAEARDGLERADRASLDQATSVDAAGFWDDVASDLDERRVCGLAPIWTLLAALGPSGRAAGGPRGRLLHYEQTVDREDGSIVSHAALGFYS